MLNICCVTTTDVHMIALKLYMEPGAESFVRVILHWVAFAIGGGDIQIEAVVAFGWHISELDARTRYGVANMDGLLHGGAASRERHRVVCVHVRQSNRATGSGKRYRRTVQTDGVMWRERLTDHGARQLIDTPLLLRVLGIRIVLCLGHTPNLSMKDATVDYLAVRCHD